MSESASNRHHTFNIRLLLRPILPFMERPDVSEIMVNGPDDVRIDVGGRIERTDVRFDGEDDLMAAVRSIAQFVGKRLDPGVARFDARLPDGSRVHVVLPPASRQGICIAIRRFKATTLSLDDLVEGGALTDEAREFVGICVAIGRNIVVSGSTSSGKTTLLNVLSSLIPAEERVIVLEDTHELQLSQDHVLYFEARPATEDDAAVTIGDLFHSALRMRPDRIVVGECRGGEALDLIQALTSGHGGSMTTLHARGPTDALNRLETMALMAGVEIPLTALRPQVVSAVDIVVQVSRVRDGRRRITEIAEVLGLDEQGRYQMQSLYALAAEPSAQNILTDGSLRWTGKRPSFADELDRKGARDMAQLTAPLFG